MATLLDLQTDILDIIQEPAETESTVLIYINRCLKYVASQILLSMLETEGNISSESTGITDIPESWNFHRNLFDCQVEDANTIEILNSIEQLKRIYPNYDVDATSGQVEYVLVHKGQIIYYPIPDAGTTLECKFYEIPTDLENPTDEPSCIVEGLQEDIIINYCCMKIYDKKEDGIEGAKVNTTHYARLFKAAMEELEDTTDTGQSRALPRRPIGWI